MEFFFFRRMSYRCLRGVEIAGPAMMNWLFSMFGINGLVNRSVKKRGVYLVIGRRNNKSFRAGLQPRRNHARAAQLSIASDYASLESLYIPVTNLYTQTSRKVQQRSSFSPNPRRMTHLTHHCYVCIHVYSHNQFPTTTTTT